jgi:hypothetical protein
MPPWNMQMYHEEKEVHSNAPLRALLSSISFFLVLPLEGTVS